MVASLPGGQPFTVFVLSHVYNQLLLDENSHKYVTIDIHVGLYQYTLLPVEYASTPAIFQHTMDIHCNESSPGLVHFLAYQAHVPPEPGFGKFLFEHWMKHLAWPCMHFDTSLLGG